MTKSNQHGGRRKGAGKKPILGETLVKISVRVKQEHADLIKSQGNGDVSQGMRLILDKVFG